LKNWSLKAITSKKYFENYSSGKRTTFKAVFSWTFFLKIFNEEAMCNVSEKDLVKSLTTINLAHNANPLVP